KDTKQELIDFLDGDVLSKECEIHEPIERPIIQIPEEATVPTGPISCSIELVGQSNYIWSGTSSIKVLLTTVSNIVLWKIVSNTKEVYVFGVPYNGDYKYATANGEGEKVRFSTATTSPSVMDLDLNEDLSDPRAFKLEYDSLSGQDRLVPSMYPTLGVTRGLYDRLYTEQLDSNTDNWVIYT
uniref:Uncharacterized protein n=1 Tax=Ciona savignyi TaxID=51511 RepID=H2YZ47_CIOSA